LPSPVRSRATLFPYTTLFRSFQFTSGELPQMGRWVEEMVVIPLVKLVVAQHCRFLSNLRHAQSRQTYLTSVNASMPSREPSRPRSEEHTSELQSRENLVCRLL